jgi:hypothetical protein
MLTVLKQEQYYSHQIYRLRIVSGGLYKEDAVSRERSCEREYRVLAVVKTLTLKRKHITCIQIRKRDF